MFQQATISLQGQSFETLIKSLGSAEFSEALLACLNTISHVDHFSIVSLSTEASAELVSSASLPGDKTAPSAQNAYIHRYHQVDPNRQLLSQFTSSHSATGAPYTVHHLERDQIHNAGYRHDCYVQPGLLDRYSIILPEKGQIRCLNLYRYASSGHFPDRDLFKLAQNAGLLAAFTSKHCALVGSGPTGETYANTLERITQRLRAMGFGFSKREVEVASRILNGYSSEGIALELGVSQNTVLTYRKRIYAKAGINSQNALFALCLGKAHH